MRKLREEGPIIKEVSDLMLARVWLPGPQGGLGGRGGEVPGRGVRWAVWCPFSLSVRRPRPGGAPAGGRTVLLLSVHRPGADQDQAAQGEPVPALHAGTRGLCLSLPKPASPVLVRLRGRAYQVHPPSLRLPAGPQLQAPWPILSTRVGDQHLCSIHTLPRPLLQKHCHVPALKTETPDLPSDGPAHLLVPVFTQMDLSFFVYKVGVIPALCSLTISLSWAVVSLPHQLFPKCQSEKLPPPFLNGSLKLGPI